MKQNLRLWAVFSLLLAVAVALAGIWANHLIPPLRSGETLTPAQTAQGVALTGWEETSPGRWSVRLTADPAAAWQEPVLLCCADLSGPCASAPLTDAPLGSKGEFFYLSLTPGQELALTLEGSRSPQAWLMSAACASHWVTGRLMLQVISLTAFATMWAVILALYVYKREPPLRYFLLYLSVVFFWGILVLCWPSGTQGLLWWVMRTFFSVMILACLLLSAALLDFPLSPRLVLPASVVFLVLGTLFPALPRSLLLMAGMFWGLGFSARALWLGNRAARLILFPCALTTGLRVLTLLPGLRSPLYIESSLFYLIRCARIFDIPFALGCMFYVCRRFAMQFDRTEQLARELDARVVERTQALTEESEARKSMMLNIFHDLRSPLFAVSSGLDALAEAPEALPALLPALQQRIAFVRRLTEDLFLAAKLEQKQVLLNEDRICLAQAARTVCTACQSEAAQKHITLALSDTDPLPVWGDEVRLEQVLQNLLTNAIHYTPAGGRIDVAAFRADGCACVSVRDTGCGIAPEDQAAVFDRYFHTTADTKHDSTGLGLTIAQELARLHHGEISLQSAVGKGSCFTLRLPLLDG